MKAANDITCLIGNTPVVRLRRLVPPGAAEVYLKLECFNAGGSVKDRIALNMIRRAEEEGRIKPGDTLLEVTSGNTGIGVAMVGAAKGYRVVIVMGDNVSAERRAIIRAYGARLVIVSAKGGIQASFDKAAELAAEYGYFQIRQFENPANPQAHVLHTGPEILEDFAGVPPDAFVSGVGTGGTITGAGGFLRKHNPSIRIIAVEPDASPVLSGGTPSPHAIQGIGAGIIPAVLDTQVYDGVFRVKNEEALRTAGDLAAKEGLLLGISSGAAAFAAIHTAKELGEGKTVLAIAPDTGERYLSTPLYSEEDA
jgi:cysteine synthase A